MLRRRTLNLDRYRFNVGNFKCIVVNDGTFAYPYPAQNVFINFFVNAPHENLKETLNRHGLDPDKWKEYISPYPCLVINTGEHLVLVDTGAGSLDPTTGRLVSNLQAEGITPEDIDRVILTHGHPDHIGGTINEEGNPTFPNARYVIWKDEWDFWASEPNLDGLKIGDHGKEILVKTAQDNLLPLRDQIDLISQETFIVPGIRVISAKGHTPGHMVVEVISGDDRLLCTADTVLHPIHLEKPDWYSSVAVNPDIVVESRSRILGMASDEDVPIHVSHFSFPGLGYVQRREDGWLWKHIEA